MSDWSVTSLLRRNNELQENLVKLQLNTALNDELSDLANQMVSELTDNKSGAEVSKELKISVGKISGIRRRWEQKGMLINDGHS